MQYRTFDMIILSFQTGENPPAKTWRAAPWMLISKDQQGFLVHGRITDDESCDVDARSAARPTEERRRQADPQTEYRVSFFTPFLM